jgi:hypothetical protein
MAAWNLVKANLAGNPKIRERAEANFKKSEVPLREGNQACAEYQIHSTAIREKTARLKSLRLAKEAAEQSSDTASTNSEHSK